jgi:cell wall-associated NlpC family hydrolase
MAALFVAAVVGRPVANMHSKPSAEAEVVSQAIYGAQISVIEQRAGWARVRTADEYTGWMAAGAFRPGAYASSGRAAFVETLFANVYREPDVTKHAPLLTLPYEARLEAAAEPAKGDRRWIEVRLVDGSPAWVQSGDLTFDPPRLAVAAIADYARRFLGLPYLWGGTSTFGYDCSGFVQMLYRRAGVTLPRDAQPQADWSGLARVERAELRPGDLLYFGASPRKITHTGLYAGNGEFIDATVHERPVVRLDRLADPFWEELFVGARRLK